MLDRKTPPLFQKNITYPLLQPEQVSLANGVTLNFINGGDQEVVKIEFIFKAGKWYEHLPGISYFTAHLLQKGTRTKTAFQISTAFDQYGVHVEVNPGYDFASLALYGLTKNINRVLQLFLEVITEPAFAELELQQTKDIYIQGLKINLEKTSYLASRLLRKNLFGLSHPYGHDAEINDINSLEPPHLTDFHRNYFRNLEVICSGKITEEIKKTLSTLLTDFVPSTSLKDQSITPEPGPALEYLEKSNSVQSSIRFGKPIISRTHQDYPALLLLNHIFGGYFGSRLMKNIREEKGLTYGIHSSVTALKHHSYLSIGADVNKENRELVIQEIKNELKHISSQLIKDSELETARNHFIGSLQSEISTPFAHADKIKNIMLFNLSPHYYSTFLEKVESLSALHLLEIAQNYFDEKSFTIVAAG